MARQFRTKGGPHCRLKLSKLLVCLRVSPVRGVAFLLRKMASPPGSGLSLHGEGSSYKSTASEEPSFWIQVSTASRCSKGEAACDEGYSQRLSCWKQDDWIAQHASEGEASAAASEQVSSRLAACFKEGSAIAGRVDRS